MKECHNIIEEMILYLDWWRKEFISKQEDPWSEYTEYHWCIALP